MHVVPNSEIKVVSNMTRGWSRAVVDVGITYEEDIDRALAVVRDEAAQFSTDKSWGAQLDGPLEVPGIESLSDSAVVIRTLIKTQPGSQWAMAREFRRRLKKRLDREGISIPYPPAAGPRSGPGRAGVARGGSHRRRGRRMSLALYNTLTRRIDPLDPLAAGQGVAVHLRPHHLQLRSHRELPDLPLRGPAAPLARGQRVRGLPYHEPDRRGRPDDRGGRRPRRLRSGPMSIRSPARSRRTGTGSGSCRRTPSRGRPSSSPP